MLFKDLTSEQKQAVKAPIGNIKVVAVAGAGKTSCLSFRVKELVNNGVDPSEILLITFSNKAAREITTRVSYVLPDIYFESHTFHSFGLSLCKKYYNELGLDKNIEIINNQVKKTLMESSRQKITKEMGVRGVPKYNVLLEMYSGAINHNKKFSDYITQYYGINKKEVLDAISLIFKDYVINKQKMNYLDFDDLLLNTYDLLTNDKTRRKINKQYKHIIVDEYQDINFIQYEIIKKLNANNSLFIIGDSSQCIYEWRGSMDKYIEEFEQDFPNAQVFNLTTNFRSTQEILDFAEDSINHNPVKEDIRLTSMSKHGNKPLIFSADNPKEAYEIVAQDISSNYLNDLNNVAVLLRYNAECSDVKQIFDKMSVPAQIDKTKNLTSTKHFNDLRNFLLFLETPSEESISLVLPFFQLPKSKHQDLIKYLKSINFDFSLFNYNKDQKVSDLFSVIIPVFFTKDISISDRLQKFFDLFYKEVVIKNRTNHEQIFEDIEHVINQSKSFKTTSDFINFYTINDDEEASSGPSVKIITLHKSKGLEFNHVYILGLNNELIPKSSNVKEVINERKLFYVGCTRAKEDLVLCFYERDVNGQPLEPSIFLEEVSQDLYDLD